MKRSPSLYVSDERKRRERYQGILDRGCVKYMHRTFRQIERTEEYCLYECSHEYHESRQIMYWFEDQTVKVYQRMPIEKGNDREGQLIKGLFLLYIAEEGFPEEAEILTIDPRDARWLYRHLLKDITNRLKRAQEHDQQMMLEAINRSNLHREDIEEIIKDTYIFFLYNDYYERGLEFYRSQGLDRLPREPVSNRRLQPETFEIEELFIEVKLAIDERMQYLYELADKAMRPMIFPSQKRALIEWNEQESRRLQYGIIDQVGDSDERLRYIPEREGPEEEETDLVNYTVLSPKAVQPDSYGIIECYMYTDPDRPKVDSAIRNSDGLVNETTKTGFDISRDTAVTVRLESRDAVIEDQMETRTWNGRFLEFDFQFYVPEDYERKKLAFTCYIEYNGIPVTRMHFLVNVSCADNPDHIPAKVTRDDFAKAFISYSRRDEQRMLARVLGIQEMAPGLKFWLDKQSMDAGDLWRDEIRNAIQMSDLLLLFWSAAASKSVEVEKEWRYGLEQKGLEFIAPVPLDPPEMCPPPDDLGELNFNVRAFSMNDMTRSLSFFDTKNIQGI